MRCYSFRQLFYTSSYGVRSLNIVSALWTVLNLSNWRNFHCWKVIFHFLLRFSCRTLWSNGSAYVSEATRTTKFGRQNTLGRELEAVQTWLDVLWNCSQELYETFTLSEEDSKNITKVLEAFEARCVPMQTWSMNVTCLTNAHKRLERASTTSLLMFLTWWRIVNMVTLKMI